MSRPFKLSILSDIHYASPEEQKRRDYNLQGVNTPLRRLLFIACHRYIWLRDPFAHNHLLDQFIAQADSPDLVVANGDYSCDSAFVGVSDEASFLSAQTCLQKLRDRFGTKFHASFGDHELGKASLGGGMGGLRLESYRRAVDGLGLQPFWKITVGRYVLLGLASYLAFPIYEPESLPEEGAEWSAARVGPPSTPCSWPRPPAPTRG